MATQTTVSDMLLRALGSERPRLDEEGFPHCTEPARKSHEFLVPYPDMARDYGSQDERQAISRHTETCERIEDTARPSHLVRMPAVLQQSMASFSLLTAAAQSSRSIARVIQPMAAKERRPIDAFLDDTDRLIRGVVAHEVKRPIGELADSELCRVADDLMQQRGAEDLNHQRILAEDTDKCTEERVGYQRLAGELKLSPPNTPFRDARRPDMCHWFQSAHQMSSRLGQFNGDDDAKRRAVELKRSVEGAARLAEARENDRYDPFYYRIGGNGTIIEVGYLGSKVLAQGVNTTGCLLPIEWQPRFPWGGAWYTWATVSKDDAEFLRGEIVKLALMVNGETMTERPDGLR